MSTNIKKRFSRRGKGALKEAKRTKERKRELMKGGEPSTGGARIKGRELILGEFPDLPSKVLGIPARPFWKWPL